MLGRLLLPMTILLVGLAVSPDHAYAQAVKAKPGWATCSYDAADGAFAQSPVFRAGLLEGGWNSWPWVQKFSDATYSARASRMACDAYETRDEAEAERQRHIDFYSSRRPIVTLNPPADTGLAGASAAQSAPPPKPKPVGAPSSAGSLTIKTDTSLRDAGKAWDEQVKKTLAEEARKKVETAVKNAQANAKAQAEAEAFFKERRRQGRAQ